ncbi:MAG: YigZ family protein [Clostridia bacterium]|nr:YigZ family protein [Clostridia bacterium]
MSLDNENLSPVPVLYTTVEGQGEDRFEEKRSEFIGRAAHVTSEEEAMAFIKGLQKQYADATHNVWAYRISGGTSTEQAARYSDDGEPQGSSGLPTLEAIRKKGVFDCVVVTTRYFGGILLGVGGLIRAYSHAASIALDAAKIITYEKYTEFMLETTYSDYQIILQELPRYGVLTDDSEFSDRVTLTLAVKKTHYADMEARLSEITAGRCFLMEMGERFDYR